MCVKISQQLQDVHVSDFLLWSPNKETKGEGKAQTGQV